MTSESGFFLLFRIFVIFTWLGISSVWKHKRKTSAKKLSGFFSEKKRAIQFTQDLYIRENNIPLLNLLFSFLLICSRAENPALYLRNFFCQKTWCCNLIGQNHFQLPTDQSDWRFPRYTLASVQQDHVLCHFPVAERSYTNTIYREKCHECI